MQKAEQTESAWIMANRLVLGQVKVHEKNNEISLITQLLLTLAVTGCIVTIDALGCHAIRCICHGFHVQRSGPG